MPMGWKTKNRGKLTGVNSLFGIFNCFSPSSSQGRYTPYPGRRNFGGSSSLSDLEVSRAIAYMVSGGHAADPDKPYSSPRHRTGEQIVQERCQACHGTGKEGAPRIGDMAAWQPRLKAGGALGQVGHRWSQCHAGPGGMAQLSDAEMAAAVIYMINLTAVTALKK
jgi:cytochrome c5